MWDWVDGLRLGIKPDQAFVGIFARGGGKSTCAEASVVYAGAKRRRRYALYVRGTQDQADNSVDNIASLLESPVFGEAYPDLSNKQVGKFGQTKGWRRNRLRTASGFTVDAFGLDTALRGVKIEERRPDLIIIDDVDAKHDTISTTLRKIEKITTSVLPAGSGDCAILCIQNLIISHGFFARLADNTADYLYNRKVVGPIPAIRNLEVEQVWDKKKDKQVYKITGGEPTWELQGIDVCEAQINDWGYISFQVEAQHDVDVVEGGTFSGVNYNYINFSDCPKFKRVVCWIDPAVSDSDDADCMGIQIDALGMDRKVYRLYSWEDRASPETVIRRAIQKAYEYTAREIGFETDQGGVLWRSEYYRVYDLMVSEGEIPENYPRPTFRSAKAGSIGSKRHRQNMHRSAYDRGLFVHVKGTHNILENALKRFPIRKPYDLCLVGGTLITTKHGDIPIQNVQIGDRVWTRNGYRQVVQAGRTSLNAEVYRMVLANGKSLVGTYYHPVWTQERGWVPLGETEGLYVILPLCTKPSNPSKWNTGVEFIDAIPRQVVDPIEFTMSLQESKIGSGIYTDRSILTNMERSPKTEKFTTSTVIRSTIRPKTWLALPWGNIDESIMTIMPIPRKFMHTLNGYEKKQLNGIVAKKVESGIESMGNELRPNDLCESMSVACVERSFTPGLSQKYPFTAQQNVAMPLCSKTHDLLNRDHVQNVERLFRLADTAEEDSVAVPVVGVTPNGRHDVYNLAVEENHEYLANGIVVHNCDAAYWSQLSLLRFSGGWSKNYTGDGEA